jgi:hypothetical protein
MLQTCVDITDILPLCREVTDMEEELGKMVTSAGSESMMSLVRDVARLFGAALTSFLHTNTCTHMYCSTN